MIGAVIGNYRILQKLGEGGMGTVYKGEDMMLEREVAIKALRQELTNQPQLAERFRGEAITLAKLNHPNIATLHSFFRQGDEYFMVMEFVRGETLDNFLRRAGTMPVERAITLFCQALDGIGHAHSLGIIHRDIKPANMMLTTNGSIKVMDFGIARVLGTSRMTRQGNIVGTIEYMSPEAIQGMDVDARSDIYSLGLLLYEMLTGRLPFVSDSEFQMMMAQIQQAPPPPRTFAPHIPVVIEQAIMRSLAKKPEARFQDVMDFRRVVEGGVQGAPTQPAQRPPAIAPTRMGAGPASPPLSTGPALPQPPGQTAMPPAPGYQPNSPWQPQPATPPQGYGPPAFQPQTATPPQGMAPPQYPNYSQPQFGQQPSFMSRLNWKHYTAGAAALFLLILAPFVIMAFMKGPEPPPQKNTPLVSPQPDPVTENKPSVNKEPDTQPYTGGEKIEETTSIPPDSSEDPNAGKTKPSKPARKDDAAARERARKRAEAKRLLDQ